MKSLNGIAVNRRSNTLFVPLPRSAWVEIEGGCSCSACTAAGFKIAFWDTMAVAEKPSNNQNDTTWMIHAPEMQLDYRNAVAANERKVDEAERAAALKRYAENFHTVGGAI